MRERDEVGLSGGGEPVEPDRPARAETPAHDAQDPSRPSEARSGVDEALPAAAEGRELAEAIAQRDEYLDALRRLQADFENYKKRMVKQQTEHLERAAEHLVSSLLPALDALDLAVAHSGSLEADAGSDSLAQVANTFFDVLGKEGLDRLDPLGEPFDPTLHDAVLHEAAAEGAGQEQQVAEVTEVLRPGYRWKGRVLRPAMVKVKG